MTTNSKKYCYLSQFKWLQKFGPSFMVKAEDITVLKSPSEFYRTLLDRCRSAKHRIVIASLYLGIGNLEQELVNTIKDAMENRQKLSVRVLLDANRGSRGKVSSRTMLMSLLNPSFDCRVYLYHTPKLRGLLRLLLPERYNELIGIQHMKLYMFDDSIIISGANLSQDYFTNRQDRYILIEDCKPLLDFYIGLVELLGRMSFQLTNKNTLMLDPTWEHHPYKSPYKTYASEARKQIMQYYNTHIKHPTSKKDTDTIVYPVIEFPPFDIHHDSQTTNLLMSNAELGSTMHMATGYFNIPDIYTNSMFHKSLANFKILFSHPMANSFQQAKGPAGFIPTAYSYLTNTFFDKVENLKLHERISCFEYQRTGWTFHSKGLWYTPNNYELPVLTAVGSSNYGARSLNCDLESQLIIVTNNKKLQQNFHTEKNYVYESTSLYIPEGEFKAPLWVRLVLRVFKNYF
ncbi:PREDICTED: CDP-diacylglycerol--glycerol-3-phosphate 3-phosphatidyltransferase, mitochondrial [Diuraphis noxia]|uniref:CDP-diacylglycerol--glycerol-3-phosphate 3-phosphatidyltransferase, mitochondrial n=1 Tax=Diuraphis noxia TaxID=143948 RepID=UPI000763560C|nr:PREDICTED: CDP-diacylglycerol--glycerol-3-phosphate 3-phosphatidyltransferase, mitochondrial [Diuraphis noxia]